MFLKISGVFINSAHVIFWNDTHLVMLGNVHVDLGPGTKERLEAAFTKHFRHNMIEIANEVPPKEVQGTAAEVVSEVSITDQVPGHAFLVSAPSSDDSSNEDLSGGVVPSENSPPPPPIESPTPSKE